MANVGLTINGKPYRVDCDEGQERRVQELGRYVDSRVREIAGAGAASTDAHMLVLTTLMMADEIYELRETLGNMSRQARPVHDTMPKTAPGLSSDDEREILEAIDHLAARIDSVADRLARI